MPRASRAKGGVGEGVCRGYRGVRCPPIPRPCTAPTGPLVSRFGVAILLGFRDGEAPPVDRDAGGPAGHPPVSCMRSCGRRPKFSRLPVQRLTKGRYLVSIHQPGAVLLM